MDLVIRQYCKEDFTSVCDLERENSPQGCKPEVFIRQAGVLFADTFLVAECGGEVIGYTIGALVQQRPATGWIIRLVVSGKHRRKGFGDSLVTAVISGLLERGAEEIYLSVAPGNRAVRALYEKHGFQETEFCPAYFGEGADRYILRRSIDDHKGLTRLY